MEEKIYEVLKKHKLPLKKREELMIDLLNLFGVSGCFTDEDMLMSYCYGASESTINDIDTTIHVGTKVDAENFLKRYKKNNR